RASGSRPGPVCVGPICPGAAEHHDICSKLRSTKRGDEVRIEDSYHTPHWRERRRLVKLPGLMIALSLVFAAGCAGPARPTTPTGNPQWVNDLVQQFQGAPVGNPPQSIWRYEYNGQVVYFVPAQCCDMFSTLYDANGKFI